MGAVAGYTAIRDRLGNAAIGGSFCGPNPGNFPNLNYVSLETLGKKGQKHQDTPTRNFLDPEDEFLERWELLGLG